MELLTVKTLLDPGSGIAAISEKLVHSLQDKYRDSNIMLSSSGRQYVRVADGRNRLIDCKTCPLHVRLHSAWGPVTLRNKIFAVMPGNDEVVIIGSKTLRDDLGIDVKQNFDETARMQAQLVVNNGVCTTKAACDRVNVTVAHMYNNNVDDASDAAMQVLLARTPDVMVVREQEMVERNDALCQAIEVAAAKGLSYHMMRYPCCKTLFFIGIGMLFVKL